MNKADMTLLCGVNSLIGLANDLMKKYTVKTVASTTIIGTEVLRGRVRRSGWSGKVSLKRTFHRRCAR